MEDLNVSKIDDDDEIVSILFSATCRSTGGHVELQLTAALRPEVQQFESEESGEVQLGAEEVAEPRH